MAAPKKGNSKGKKGVGDFLKDKPNDRSEKISGKDIFSAASLKNENHPKGFRVFTLDLFSSKFY